jgi:hypothetical protein
MSTNSGAKRVRTKVVNMYRERYDVDITRRSIWGNPFVIGRDGTRSEVIEKYQQWIIGKPGLMAQLSELKGKRLGCVCKPAACHGDVLRDLLEEPL